MKERNYSLDLYRIICMFLITTIHIFGYSNIMDSVSYTDLNFYFINFIKTLQSFSINGFVLISAYFLVNNKVSINSTVKKMISFEVQIIFYSVLIMVLSLIFSLNLRGTDVLKSFLPTLSNHYWYPVNYMFLLAVSPFLNKLIITLSKTHFKILIGIIFIGYSLLNLNPFFTADIYVGHYSHGLLWFICLYLVAAYIKLYGVEHKKLYGIVSFVVSGICLLVLNFLNTNMLDIKTNFLGAFKILKYIDLLSYNSFLPFVLTISSFILFLNIDIKLPKKIAMPWNFIIRAVFGIYLIQEHNTVRDALWGWINIERWATSPYLVLIVIAIFISLWLAAIILYLCYYYANKLFIDKIANKIQLILVKKLTFLGGNK